MIELSDLIREVRQQLTTAAAEAAGEAVQLELGPVEIEVTVAVTRAAAGSGGIRIWVLDAEAEGRLASSHTQRITLTLQPRTSRPNGAVLISDADDIERMPISGHTSPGPENDPDDDWPQES